MDKVVLKHAKELDYGAREAIRVLRASLENMKESGNVLLFTSAMSGEGKSFVAFHTASTIAASGKKCVYLNANLRAEQSADIYKAEGVKNTLALLLEGKCKPDSCIYESNHSGLYLIESGAPCANAPELLASAAYSELIDYLRQNYDYVIIDTPAVGIVADALVIGRSSDGVVLVMESGVVPYELAQRVKKQLEMNECKILGVVLNK